jgi:hypothetical protein
LFLPAAATALKREFLFAETVDPDQLWQSWPWGARPHDVIGSALNLVSRENGMANMRLQNSFDVDTFNLDNPYESA